MAQSPEDLERLLVPGLAVSGDAASGPILDVDHGGHRARISLFGGHVFAWQPAGQAPVLWVSPGLRQSSGIDTACLAANADAAHSHDNLFHSVLGLMQVETQVRDPALDIFAACRTGASS